MQNTQRRARHARADGIDVSVNLRIVRGFADGVVAPNKEDASDNHERQQRQYPLGMRMAPEKADWTFLPHFDRLRSPDFFWSFFVTDRRNFYSVCHLSSPPKCPRPTLGHSQRPGQRQFGGIV